RVCKYACVFFVYTVDRDRVLHSFPTRRSSDLASARNMGSLELLGNREVKRGAAISRNAPSENSSIRAPRASASTTSRGGAPVHRSEEHTSELQSREKLVCRLLLEKKKNEQQRQ